MTRSMKKSGNTLGARRDDRSLIEFAIESIVSGPRGVFLAIEEILYNASDAGAENILIKYAENKDGTINISFMDDGHGFRRNDMVSAMGYFNSSKLRSDDTTSGVNGSGMKHLLGLGEFKKTKVRIESIADDKSNVLKKGFFDIDYLVGFGQTHFADDYISTSGLPKNIVWSFDVMPRKSGSNIILENADKEKVYTPLKLINNLAKYLTPKIAKKVKVYHNIEWHALKPVQFGVPVFSRAYNRKELGRVEFELFVDPKYNRNNLQICGPENRIMDLSKLLSLYSSLPDELNVLASCGGYIYVQKGNVWRLHNNTLKEQYFKSGAAKAFKDVLVQICNLVAPMLEQDEEEDDNGKKEFQQRDLVDTLLKKNRMNYGTFEVGDSEGGIGGRKKPKKAKTHSSGISLRPTRFIMKPGEVQEIELTNVGPTDIDLSMMSWDDSNSPIKAEYDPGIGQFALLTAGDDDSKGFIRLTHPDYKKSWKFDSIVAERPKNYISGPSEVYAGRTFHFELKEIQGDVEILWVLDKQGFATLSQDGFTTTMKCEKVVMKKSKSLVLRAMSYDRAHTFAEKKLVYHPVIDEPGSKLLSFGDFNFELKMEPQGINSALAQVGADWQSNDVPIIGINFASQRYEQVEEKAVSIVKKMRFAKSDEGKTKSEYQLKQILYSNLLIAIATAAMGYVIEKKDVERNEALKLYEEFLKNMKL